MLFRKLDDNSRSDNSEILSARKIESNFMDDKYNVRKDRKPETKQEAIQQEIEELIKRRDRLSNLAEKQAIQKQIMKLFAQYERLKL